MYRQCTADLVEWAYCSQWVVWGASCSSCLFTGALASLKTTSWLRKSWGSFYNLRCWHPLYKWLWSISCGRHRIQMSSVICIRTVMALAIISHLKASNQSTRCDVVRYNSTNCDAGVHTIPPPRGGGVTSFLETLQPSTAWVEGSA
jgi:hypothetical protein